MIIVFQKDATLDQEQEVLKKIETLGLQKQGIGGYPNRIMQVSEERYVDTKLLENCSGVVQVILQKASWKQALDPSLRRWSIAEGLEVGGKALLVVAGPCTVENELQIQKTAHIVKKSGANVLRGGAYKPRSSPYAFRGHGVEGLKMLKAAGDDVALKVCSEVLDVRDVETVARYVDVLQVGARNMQNFTLLIEVGRTGKPVLLKRGLGATVHEWLMSAEYILSSGSRRVLLCERGIKSLGGGVFLDVKGILQAKQLSCLPVIVDPSHAAECRDFVLGLARAGLSVGADGVMVEVHHNPEKAIVDGPQAIGESEFQQLMRDLDQIAGFLGRCGPKGFPAKASRI